MQQAGSNLELCESLLGLEDELDLFRYTIEGAPFWEYVRQYVLLELQRNLGLADIAPFVQHFPLRRWLKRLQACVGGLTTRNPFFTTPRPLVFFGCPRRTCGADGLWWDTTVDPFLETLELPYFYMERPSHDCHRAPARTLDVKFYELFSILACSHRILTGLENFSRPVRLFLQGLAVRIKDRFGVPVDLAGIANTVLKARRCLLYYFRRLFRKVRPRCVFFASINYPERTALEAARQLGIPAVELQHGVIGPTDLSYVFPPAAHLRCFPDYLFLYGPYWQQCIKFPLPAERVVPVGCPYLEQVMPRYDYLARKDQVVVISQPTVGAALSRFALELSRLPGGASRIVFRLHPYETDWPTRYPWLLNTRVRISESQEPLHELLAQSRKQVGVHSAAIYEGLAFGLETYLLEAAGVENMLPLIESGAARMVSQPLEVFLPNPQARAIHREWFFRSGSLDNFRGELARILGNDSGTPVSRAA